MMTLTSKYIWKCRLGKKAAESVRWRHAGAFFCISQIMMWQIIVDIHS